MNLRRREHALRSRQRGFITFINNPYSHIAPPPPSFVVDGADFDGTDVMSRGANLTGISNSVSGIFSGWVRFDSGDASTLAIFHGSGSGDTQGIIVAKGLAGDNIITVQDNTGVATSFALYSNVSYTAGSIWRHILASWDGATGAHHLYINDVDVLDAGISECNNVAVNYANCTNWRVGDDGFAEYVQGCLAEIFFAPGQYLDLSVTNNRRKFIGSTGRPVDLGATGTAPTGTAPRAMFHLADGEAVANFATNRGGLGGNFTITGTLATSSSAPSD